MTRSRTRLVAAGAAYLAALLGVGLLTYLAGGLGQRAGGGASIPRVEVEAAAPGSLEPTVALRLPWGFGADAIWVDATGAGSTFESFAVDDRGRILVADHPRWHAGARVRRYSARGELERTWLTPSGSLFFEPMGDGIAYVLVGSKNPGERVVVVNADGSVAGTFASPQGVNSTALLVLPKAIGVTVSVPEVSLSERSMRLQEQFVPVVTIGTGNRLTAASPVAMPGYGVTADGHLFVRSRETQGLSEQSPVVHTVTFPRGRTLRVPDLCEPFAVDGDTVWFRMPVAIAPQRRIERAGWPVAAEEDAEVMAARVDGRLRVRAVVPWSERLAGARRRVVLQGGRLWVASANARGLIIAAYEVPR